jgi:hypothetical protein
MGTSSNQGFGLGAEFAFPALVVTLLVRGKAAFIILLASGDQVVDDRASLWAVMKRLRGHAERLGGSALALARARPQHFPPLMSSSGQMIIQELNADALRNFVKSGPISPNNVCAMPISECPAPWPDRFRTPASILPAARYAQNAASPSLLRTQRLRPAARRVSDTPADVIESRPHSRQSTSGS